MFDTFRNDQSKQVYDIFSGAEMWIHQLASPEESIVRFYKGIYKLLKAHMLLCMIPTNEKGVYLEKV